MQYRLIVLGVGLSLFLTGCSMRNNPIHDTHNENQVIYQTSWAVIWTWLNSGQMASLIYLVEEEKLAHDVYTTLGTYRNNQQFINIPKSESRHTTAVAEILSHYGISNPSQKQIGVFTNPELSKLYSDLITQWKESSQEALQVGIIIENKDITDIQKMLPLFEGYPDIQSALKELLKGSYNHRNAFTNPNHVSN